MTNREAEGYVLLACKDLGISKEDAIKLLDAMESNFDTYTEQEAAEKGFAWLQE